MISSLVFVRKGVAKAKPERYEMTEEEFSRFSEMAEKQVEEAREGIKEINNNNDPELAEYNLDTYDDEQDSNGLFSKGLAYYSANSEDPYITLEEKEDEEEDEDMQDLTIKETDCLILVAKTEDEISHLEVNIYEENERNLYVHHDIMLPSFPLCVEWIGHDFEGGKNFAGTFEPTIEVWNLDILDCMCPRVILGEQQPHGDAVMSLSWNRMHSNVMASGSADKTINLWDLNNPGKPVISLLHHSNKVQSLQWHSKQSSILLSGGFDMKAFLVDTRNKGLNCSWDTQSDVECVSWNPFDDNTFMVTLENGCVMMMDMRSTQPLFTLNAHSDKAVSAFDWSPFIPGIFLTASVDRTVKLWRLTSNGPSMIDSRNLSAGKLFSARFSPDSPYFAAIAGSKGVVVPWHFADNGSVRSVLEQMLG